MQEQVSRWARGTTPTPSRPVAPATTTLTVPMSPLTLRTGIRLPAGPMTVCQQLARPGSRRRTVLRTEVSGSGPRGTEEGGTRERPKLAKRYLSSADSVSSTASLPSSSAWL
jgi:hypothetical protein